MTRFRKFTALLLSLALLCGMLPLSVFTVSATASKSSEYNGYFKQRTGADSLGDGTSWETAYKIRNTDELEILAAETTLTSQGTNIFTSDEVDALKAKIQDTTIRDNLNATNLSHSFFNGVYFKLDDNFNDTTALTTPIGFFVDDNNSSSPFLGNLDGNGKTVYLKMDYSSSDNKKSVGLFGYCEMDGNTTPIIKNITTAGTVKGTSNVGGLCGRAGNVVISNSQNTAEVTGTGDGVGGICGSLEANSIAIISKCGNKGKITGHNESTNEANKCWYVGGICGDCERGVICNCYNKGEITGDRDLGGICGSSNGMIYNSYNTGKIGNSNSKFAGGICGDFDCSNDPGRNLDREECVNPNIFINKSTLNKDSLGENICMLNCYNSGKVTAEKYAGMICGAVDPYEELDIETHKEEELVGLNLDLNTNTKKAGDSDNSDQYKLSEMFEECYYDKEICANLTAIGCTINWDAGRTNVSVVMAEVDGTCYLPNKNISSTDAVLTNNSSSSQRKGDGEYDADKLKETIKSNIADSDANCTGLTTAEMKSEDEDSLLEKLNGNLESLTKAIKRDWTGCSDKTIDEEIETAWEKGVKANSFFAELLPIEWTIKNNENSGYPIFGYQYNELETVSDAKINIKVAKPKAEEKLDTKPTITSTTGTNVSSAKITDIEWGDNSSNIAKVARCCGDYTASIEFDVLGAEGYKATENTQITATVNGKTVTANHVGEGSTFRVEYTFDTVQHVWDDGKVVKNATKKHGAVRLFTCTVCQEALRTEYLPQSTQTIKLLKKKYTAKNNTVKIKAKAKGSKLRFRALNKSKYYKLNKYGRITFRNGAKGTYKIKVRIRALVNNSYKQAKVTKVIKVNVK